MIKDEKCPVCNSDNYFNYHELKYCIDCEFCFDPDERETEKKQAHKHGQYLYGKDYDDWKESKIAEEREG